MQQKRAQGNAPSLINRGVLFLMGLLFLIFGLQSPSASSLEAAVRLGPCPTSPNCVSSLADDPGQRIDPFPLSGSPAETLKALSRAIKAFPRSTLVFHGEGYLKAEFRTRLGFVDDLEFLVDEDRGVVQVRSASRTGYWDLGVNRKRVEALRKAYLEMVEKK
jgi:uncharacterized protein (DUF1499 family)